MRRSIVRLFVGIILAATAVFLMSEFQGESRRTVAALASPAAESIKVVAAKKDLPFGSVLIRDNLEYIDWPKHTAPSGTFQNMDEILKNAEGEEDNRVVIHQIFEGEPVFKRKVSGFGERPTLSRKINDNKRAVSISINDISGVAGFLLPGDHVDIMLTRSGPDNSGKLITDVILQNVVILGIDQLADENSDQPVLARTATVEVTPFQAQKLALSQQIGTMSLALRNYHNNEQAEVSRVSVNDLAGQTVGKKINGNAVLIRRGLQVEYEQLSR